MNIVHITSTTHAADTDAALERERACEGKYRRLLEILRSLKKVMVAFSGGADSALLLHAARAALGADTMAVTAVSPLLPPRDARDADAFCRAFAIERIIFAYDALAVPGLAENPPQRCYLCKKALFTQLMHLAEERGCILCEGTNTDDLDDYRPGLAALRELEVRSPLLEAGLAKSEIRQLSRKFALQTWDKPALACLASRIMYGEKITPRKLELVARAEEMLAAAGAGFTQARVRVHGGSPGSFLARIEVPAEEAALFSDLELRAKIAGALREAGFAYVTLDLEGYRQSGRNEAPGKHLDNS